MRFRRTNKKYLIIASLILVVSLGVFLFKKISLKNEIDKILTSESYSYLPLKAQNYVREVYESTGEVLRTEKNKVENEPYLNPMFVDYLEMSEDEQKEEEIIPMATIVDYYSPTNVDEATIPDRYDLRSVNGKNFVAPNRSQGDMGICWAFSSAGVVETFLMKQSNTSYSDSSQLISERQMDYATATNGINDYVSEYVSFIEDRVLGDGANFYISSLAMASGTSIFPYSSFKAYNDHDYNKEELSDVLSYSKSRYELNETINMGAMNLRESTSNLTQTEMTTRTNFLNEVKGYIQNYGAAYLSTYMNSTCYYYDSNLGNTVIDVYSCTKNNGHAMQIIGWNDNIEYKYCADNGRHTAYSSSCNNPVQGKGVWILKNSWGTSNTPNPYLAYDSMNSQIHFAKNITSMDDKNWDNSYILGDGNGLTIKVYRMSDTRLSGNEKIKKVKFITSSASGTFTVKVLDSSGRTHSYSKTTNTPGLITVDITDDVTVNSSSTITVSSSAYFYDRTEIFTSNADTTKTIDLSAYNGKSVSEAEMRIYGETKNVPSGGTITFKLLKNNVDVSNNIIVTNNIVAENNVNAIISFGNIANGEYVMKAYYGSTLLSSYNFTYEKMTGSGTSSDPYIIMNSTHLKQIENDLGAYYELGADIDLTNDTREGGKYYYIPDGYTEGLGWEPINGFYGTLDGKGHTIRGLYQRTIVETSSYTLRWNDTQGLFSNVSGNLTIKNLVLENFDMTCHEYCGALFNNYNVSFVNGNPGELIVNIENISLKNSSIVGVSNSKTVGGLVGIINASNEMIININNIYNDSYVTSNGQVGYIIGFTGGAKQINVNNIMMIGNLAPQRTGYSGGIGYTMSAGNINIKNVFSTLDNSNIAALLVGVSTIYDYDNVDNTFIVNGVNALKVANGKLIYTNNSPNALVSYNVNLYDKGVNSSDLTNSVKYTLWTDFSNNWTMQTINGVKRYPVLKNISFDYTTIPDISIDLDSSGVNLYDLMTPKTDVAKRISYSIADTSIATINSNGQITPKKLGSTTIHIESFYDGFIKDIPITVTGDYYTVKYNSNGGSGSMTDSVFKKDVYNKLSKNTFTRTGYIFTGWNRSSNGGSSSFTDQQNVINLTTVGNTITLYAMWEPITYSVIYNSNGGSGSMSNQTMVYGNSYTLTKNKFTKTEATFKGWNTKADGSGKTYSDQATVSNLVTTNNGTITLYAQWQENNLFSVSGYVVDNNKNYIDLIPYNTTLSTFKSHITSNFDISVDLNGKSYIYTGSETLLYRDGYLYKYYTNIVRGDINGDAKISALDYVAVKNHIMGSNKIKDDVTSRAADVNNDGKISALDYVSIKNIIMGG